MTRLAALHPKWASREERLGNNQASAAGEVHADDTEMVARYADAAAAHEHARGFDARPAIEQASEGVDAWPGIVRGPAALVP